MSEPTEKEISHALGLLRDSKEWEGRYTVIAVDKVCRWDDGNGWCNKPLYNVVVLLCDDKSVELVGLCEHHCICMVSAIKQWREMN